jgi:hypothetical protein
MNHRRAAPFHRTDGWFLNETLSQDGPPPGNPRSPPIGMLFRRTAARRRPAGSVTTPVDLASLGAVVADLPHAIRTPWDARRNRFGVAPSVVDLVSGPTPLRARTCVRLQRRPRPFERWRTVGNDLFIAGPGSTADAHIRRPHYADLQSTLLASSWLRRASCRDTSASATRGSSSSTSVSTPSPGGDARRARAAWRGREHPRNPLPDP